MKKITKLLLVILNIIGLFLIGLNTNANSEFEYAQYLETTKLIEQDLGYGVKHTKTNATSSTKICTNVKDSLTDVPQQINYVSIPSSTSVKIVNYTFPGQSGWVKQTLSKIVHNFELKNPGWTVLAGINGDFYDINGKDKALPFHTNGTTVSNGEVLRAHDGKCIGFTNDGSTQTLKYTNNITFTNDHLLTIYDNDDNIIQTIKIDKINQMPNDNEIAIYYSYRVNVDNDGDGSYDTSDLVTTKIPGENNFIVENPDRCLPTAEPEIYGRGQISVINTEKELKFGQFGLIVNNPEVAKLLNEGTTIRVQKAVTGELENLEQIMNVGSTLMENGQPTRNNSDGMREQRHPRTCVGVKEDGTMMFFVIDGRQESKKMYGMTEDEETAMLNYYGCVTGFNIDGGGSSTLGIRDENGDFVIMNTPSDGGERSVSNALLVVVPNIQIQKSEITDTSIKLSYGKLTKGITISNLKVTIDGITKEMNSNEFVFDGLLPETEYELTYNYDLTYNGGTTNVDGNKYTFKTGSLRPSVKNGYFELVNNQVHLNFIIEDEKELSTFICLEYSKNLEFIDDIGLNTFDFALDEIENFNFIVEINYNVNSVPNRNGKILEALKWKSNFNYNPQLYFEKDKQELNLIISDAENYINSNLSTLTKNELINKINEVQTIINNVKTIEEQMSEAKTNAISKIKQYKESLNLNKKKQKKVDEIVNDAISKINNANDITNIENIVLETIAQIDNASTKSCKLFSTIIPLLITSFVLVYLIRKNTKFF